VKHIHQQVNVTQGGQAVVAGEQGQGAAGERVQLKANQTVMSAATPSRRWPRLRCMLWA
jgi:hypothetical protein